MTTTPLPDPSKPPKKYKRQPKFGGKSHPGWQKGQSGNPLGRQKKELSIFANVRDILDEVVKTGDSKGKTWARLVAETLVRAATMPQHKAFSTAISELLNRIDGKPIDLSANITINMTPQMIADAQQRLQAAQKRTEEILAAPKIIALTALSEHTQENEGLADKGS